MPEDLQSFAEHQGQIEELQTALARSQRQLKTAKDYGDRLIVAAQIAAKDAVLSLPKPKIINHVIDTRKAKAEVALWHMTDWQGAKVTTSYNQHVMRDRVLEFAKKAAQITEIQRFHHPVKEATILFGGDMIEGIFNFPNQVFEIDATLFTQWTIVSGLIVDVVRFALSVYEKVNVIAEWGNHGRVGSKRDSVPRSDNFDRMCYEFARQVLAGDGAVSDRLTWDDCPEDIQRVEIGNYRALLIHGDEIGRGGFASPMSILAHANRWRSGAYPWDFKDVYIGHYHNHAEWPMANGDGAVYQTGSTESDNRYARETMAASAKPSQRLHFIDANKGIVTAQYKVLLNPGSEHF